jgi:hypothetical protein
MSRWRSGLWSVVALCVALADSRSGWLAVCACLIGAAMISVLLITERGE